MRHRHPLSDTAFRELVEREFAFQLNPGIDPAALSRGSRHSCYWQHFLLDGTLHVWRTSPRERAGGSRCPHCQNRTTRHGPVPFSNSVAADATLASQWDPEANEGMDPASVNARNTRRFAWRCPIHDWTWQQSPYLRTTRGYGCPVCSGKILPRGNSLDAYIDEHPELQFLRNEWDLRIVQPTLAEVSPESTRMLHWRCTRGHTWRASPAVRVSRRNGCPACSGRVAGPINNLEALAPHLAREWHPHLNQGLSPSLITVSSGRKVWWRCLIHGHHEWRQSPAVRLRNPSCPFCTGQRTHPRESLAARHPELAAQWHASLNGMLTPDQVRSGSNRKVWWTCGVVGHDPWKTSPHERTARASGCPQCSGRKASPDNNLRRHIEEHPHLAHLLGEWDETSNLDLSLEALTPASHTRVAWVCRKPGCGHRWKSTPHVRVRGVGCPKCDADCYATSRTEILLRNELAWVFGAGVVREGKGFPMASGKLRKADIVIESLRLVVEYDGAYYHSEQLRPGRTASDRAKTQALREAGFQVIRVREAPLEALDPTWDVVVRSPKSNWNLPNFHRWLKEATDHVLARIRRNLPIESHLWDSIERYLGSCNLQSMEWGPEEIRNKRRTGSQ